MAAKKKSQVRVNLFRRLYRINCMNTIDWGGDSKIHLPEIYFSRPHLLYWTSFLKKHEMSFMIWTRLRPDLLEHLNA